MFARKSFSLASTILNIEYVIQMHVYVKLSREIQVYIGSRRNVYVKVRLSCFLSAIDTCSCPDILSKGDLILIVLWFGDTYCN